ncbi:MAG: hypothetical protein RQ760_21575, partial [Sedimentisphaerales bacterium]|nr:hypothetical protein [Sedimentisphaerales bacterium]
MRNNIRNAVLLSSLITLLICKFSYALSVGTHQEINEHIARNNLNGFSLTSYLKKNLGIESITASFRFRGIWQLFRDGGEYEDDPSDNLFSNLYISRYTNHFHNPVAPTLADAGFTGIWGTGFKSGESTILWSQRPKGTQNREGNYSWHDVREYYRLALTSPNPDTRNRYFAETFRGIGQQMHLVHDMSVPEHTRNDGHYVRAYEAFVKNLHSAQNIQGRAVFDAALANPIFFDMSQLSQPSPFAEADVPIANLFDGNVYDGSKPDDTKDNIVNPSVSSIGLAEYTNANFVTPDTIFRGFSYPSKQTSVTKEERDFPDYVNPGNFVKRKYYIKRADGETNGTEGYRLAGVDYLNFYRELTVDPEELELVKTIAPMDDFVYEDYAKLLLPRAVGYSAALINYFFRGKLAASYSDGGLEVTNRSSEEMSFYTDSEGNNVGEITIYYDMADGRREYLASYELTTPLEPGESTPPIVFSPPTENEKPGRYIVVFHGKLGKEEGAVVGLVTEPSKVYYVSRRNGVYKIVSTDENGNGETVVFDNQDAGLTIGKIALSPDKKTLAFDAAPGPGIYLLDLEEKQAPLLTSGAWPSWSPDGKKIVFHRETGNYLPLADVELFAADVATGAVTPLTNAVGSSKSAMPAWSPDGSRIAYSLFEPEGCGGALQAIALMDSAGNQIGPVTCQDGTGATDSSPAWSPDGKEIAFTRHTYRGSMTDSYHKLYKVDVGAQTLTELTDSTGFDYAEFTPAWSPDGKKIAIG